MLRFALMAACVPLPSAGQTTGKAFAFSTLAGWASPGSDDGTGGAARFSYPTGVAADGAGNLYIADASNGTIRKVTQAGAVTTFAGTAGQFGSKDGQGPAATFPKPLPEGLNFLRIEVRRQCQLPILLGDCAPPSGGPDGASGAKRPPIVRRVGEQGKVLQVAGPARDGIIAAANGEKIVRAQPSRPGAANEAG